MLLRVFPALQCAHVTEQVEAWVCASPSSPSPCRWGRVRSCLWFHSHRKWTNVEWHGRHQVSSWSGTVHSRLAVSAQWASLHTPIRALAFQKASAHQWEVPRRESHFWQQGAERVTKQWGEHRQLICWLLMPLALKCSSCSANQRGASVSHRDSATSDLLLGSGTGWKSPGVSYAHLCMYLQPRFAWISICIDEARWLSVNRYKWKQILQASRVRLVYLLFFFIN